MASVRSTPGGNMSACFSGARSQAAHPLSRRSCAKRRRQRSIRRRCPRCRSYSFQYSEVRVRGRPRATSVSFTFIVSVLTTKVNMYTFCICRRERSHPAKTETTKKTTPVKKSNPMPLNPASRRMRPACDMNYAYRCLPSVPDSPSLCALSTDAALEAPNPALTRARTPVQFSVSSGLSCDVSVRVNISFPFPFTSCNIMPMLTLEDMRDQTGRSASGGNGYD